MCIFFIQVQWNLFSATSLVCDAKDGNKQTARAFTPWVEIEDNYRKYGSQDEFSMKPRFYNLSRTDFNNQDAPKLDGLVCITYESIYYCRENMNHFFIQK